MRPRPDCSVVDRTCPTSGTNPILLDGDGNPTENNGFTDSVRFRNVSPKLGLQYELPAGQIYAHWTRGFRSGGYNFRITNANAFEAIVGTDFAFNEEQVDNYEIGGKFQSDDGNLTFNIAGYITTIEDMQREVNQADPASGVAQSIFNTANATILGIEADARVRITDSLLLTGNIGVIDAEYDEILFDISGDGVIDNSDLELRIPRVPEITYGVGLIHELFLGDNEILSRINYQYRDDFAFTDDNRGFIQSINNLEANITWVTPIEGFSLSVYGRNLFDEVQAGGDTQLPFGGPLSDGIGDPFGNAPAAGTFSPLQRGRTLGVEAIFEF